MQPVAPAQLRAPLPIPGGGGFLSLSASFLLTGARMAPHLKTGVTHFLSILQINKARRTPHAPPESSPFRARTTSPSQKINTFLSRRLCPSPRGSEGEGSSGRTSGVDWGWSREAGAWDARPHPARQPGEHPHSPSLASHAAWPTRGSGGSPKDSPRLGRKGVRGRWARWRWGEILRKKKGQT